MKNIFTEKMSLVFLVLCVCTCLSVRQANAGLNISYNGIGTDGDLSPTAESAGVVNGVLTIDLSKALGNTWDHAITENELKEGSAVYGRGVYDASKWAVVFKYRSVNIPKGITVKFKNHPSRAPVVWLIENNVTIDGIVDVSGGDGVNAPNLAEPGPGGFRGGAGYFHANTPGSAGFGPGGGKRLWQSNAFAGGSYGTLGSYGSTVYGNPSLIPLIGGSGGGVRTDVAQLEGGGAGGGAILIVSPQNITITGSVFSKGGKASEYRGAGSGGGIRIIAGYLLGNGRIEATGAALYRSTGGDGRIRIERISVDESSGAMQIVPAPSVNRLLENETPLIWPPDSAPQVKILSVGGKVVRDDPRASFGALGPDVSIAETKTTNVVVETVNVEEAAEVFVRITNRNADHQEVAASSDTKEVVTRSPLTIRWTVSVPVELGYSAMQVRVVRP